MVCVQPVNDSPYPLREGNGIAEVQVGAGGAVVEDVVVLEVDGADVRPFRHFVEQIGGNVDERRGGRVHRLRHEFMITVPRQPLLARHVVRLAERMRLSGTGDKGAGHVVAVAGRPQAAAVAVYHNRLALANAIQVHRTAAERMHQAPPLAVRECGAQNGERKIAAILRLE